MGQFRMKVGRLRQRASFERLAQHQDDFHHGDPVWEPILDAPADIEPLQGEEAINAQQLDATVTHRVKIKYPRGVTITPADRFRYHGRVFEIRSAINVDERNMWLELLCTEKV